MQIRHACLWYDWEALFAQCLRCRSWCFVTVVRAVKVGVLFIRHKTEENCYGKWSVLCWTTSGRPSVFFVSVLLRWTQINTTQELHTLLLPNELLGLQLSVQPTHSQKQKCIISVKLRCWGMSSLIFRAWARMAAERNTSSIPQREPREHSLHHTRGVKPAWLAFPGSYCWLVTVWGLNLIFLVKLKMSNNRSKQKLRKWNWLDPIASHPPLQRYIEMAPQLTSSKPIPINSTNQLAFNYHTTP